MGLWNTQPWGSCVWAAGGGGASTVLANALATGDSVRSRCPVLRRILVDPVTLAETADTVTLPLADGTLTRQFREDWIEEDALSITVPDPTGVYLPGGAHPDYLAGGTRYQLELTRTAPSGADLTILGQFRLPDRPGPTYDHQRRLWAVPLEDMWRGVLRSGATATNPATPDTWSFTDIQGAVTATLAALGAGLVGEGLEVASMGLLALALGWYVTESAVAGRQKVHVVRPWTSAPYPTDFTRVHVQPVIDPQQPIPNNRDLLHIWTGSASAASFSPSLPSAGGNVLPPVQITYGGNGDWYYQLRQATPGADGYGFSCDLSLDAGRVLVQLPVTGIQTTRHRPEFNRVLYELVVLLKDGTTTPPTGSAAEFIVAAVNGNASRTPYDPGLDAIKVVLEKTQANGPAGSFLPPPGQPYADYCAALLAPALNAADRVMLTVDPAFPPPRLGTVLWLRVPEADVAAYYRLERVTLPLGAGLAQYELGWVQD